MCTKIKGRLAWPARPTLWRNDTQQEANCPRSQAARSSSAHPQLILRHPRRGSEHKTLTELPHSDTASYPLHPRIGSKLPRHRCHATSARPLPLLLCGHHTKATGSAVPGTYHALWEGSLNTVSREAAAPSSVHPTVMCCEPTRPSVLPNPPHVSVTSVCLPPGDIYYCPCL